MARAAGQRAAGPVVQAKQLAAEVLDHLHNSCDTEVMQAQVYQVCSPQCIWQRGHLHYAPRRS